MLFFGVDGTGPANDLEYLRDNKHSLISQLVHTTHGYYFRGPTLDGFDTRHIVGKVFRTILEKRSLSPDPIFLAGHSRGGAICIVVARLLKHEQIPVECLVLLDAVDKAFCNALVIPSNVKVAIHARRKGEVGSRSSFGSCGTSKEPPRMPGDYEECFFNATHAAIGGRPWTGVEKKHFADHVTPAWMNKSRDYKGTNEVKNLGLDDA